MRNDSAQKEMHEQLLVIEATATYFVFVLLSCAALYAFGLSIFLKADFVSFIYVAASLFSVIAAAGIAGGLLGFLFGIPKLLQESGVIRTMSGPQGQVASGASAGSPTTPRPLRAFAGNTNLEEISDWLRKL